ncbi:MAG: UDP-glucose/GDP-mannose dehydrogenase family protein, partial [Candidatus Mcinerneyibacterium aminivorans]
GWKHDVDLKVIQSAIDANEKQKMKMVEKIEKKMGDLENKTITILGLTFKPETDDMREAPSLTIVPELINKGAKIQTFCPEGFKEASWRLKDYEEDIKYCKNEYEAAKESDAIVILTEWHQFRGMDLKKLKKNMKSNYFFDFRNIYSHDGNVSELFEYEGVGI